MLVIEDHSLSLVWLFLCGQSMGFQLRLLIIFFYIHFTILYDFGLCVFQLMLLVVQCHFFLLFPKQRHYPFFLHIFNILMVMIVFLYGSINVLQSDLA